MSVGSAQGASIHDEREREPMNPFCTFMASNAGRIARIVAGIALIAWAVW